MDSLHSFLVFSLDTSVPSRSGQRVIGCETTDSNTYKRPDEAPSLGQTECISNAQPTLETLRNLYNTAVDDSWHV